MHTNARNPELRYSIVPDMHCIRAIMSMGDGGATTAASTVDRSSSTSTQK